MDYLVCGLTVKIFQLNFKNISWVLQYRKSFVAVHTCLDLVLVTLMLGYISVEIESNTLTLAIKEIIEYTFVLWHSHFQGDNCLFYIRIDIVSTFSTLIIFHRIFNIDLNFYA